MNTYIAINNRGYFKDNSCIFPFAIKAKNFDEAEQIFDKMKVVPDYEKEPITHESVEFFEMIDVTAEMYE